LESEAEWRKDPVLSIIGLRQYADWRRFRHADIRRSPVHEAIEHFCEKIVEALCEPWVSPAERRKQQEIDAQQRAGEEKQRGEAAWQAEEEIRRVSATRKSDADRPDFAMFRDAPFAPELVVIPTGMGSTPGEEGRFVEEGPQHCVKIGQRFAIGRHPVTFDEYDWFCNANGRNKPRDQAGAVGSGLSSMLAGMTRRLILRGCHSRPERLIGCLRRLSGNMRAGRARRHRIRSAARSRRIRPITPIRNASHQRGWHLSSELLGSS